MLGLLAQIGPLNGNALSQRADTLIGDYWTLTRSQVYRELQALEKMGFISGGPAGPRSSRPFSLTESGEHALQSWLVAVPAADVVRMPILLTMRFGERLPAERLRALLMEFAQRHRAKRDYYDQIEQQMRATDGDAFEIATVLFGRLFEEAVESWLDELPRLLPRIFDVED